MSSSEQTTTDVIDPANVPNATVEEHGDDAINATEKALKVIGVPYVKDGAALSGGDYKVMIQMSEYERTLFVFNDNVEDGRSSELRIGSGSAIVRPYASEEASCQAVGLPTGWMKGVPFASLDCQVRQCLNAAYERIISTYFHYGYERIVFPCDADQLPDQVLGTATFHVADDVLQYANNLLASLHKRVEHPHKFMPFGQIRWAMQWVDHRINEEYAKRAARMRQQATFSGVISSPSGLVKRAREAEQRHRATRPQHSIARYF